MLAAASDTTDNPIVRPFDGTISDSQNCTIDVLELSPKANGFADKYGYGHSIAGVDPGKAEGGSATITSYSGSGPSIDMQVSAFDDGAIYAVSQYWVASPRVAFAIGHSSAAESNLEVPPTSAGLTFTVQAIVLRPNGETIVTQHLTNAATQTLVLPAPVTMTSPSDGATGVDESTTFAVSGGTAATNVFSFLAADGTRIDFVTTASSLSLADLSRHGLTLAKGTAYTMSVDAYDNVPTVDAWAVGAGTDPWFSGGNVTDRSSSVTFYDGER